MGLRDRRQQKAASQRHARLMLAANKAINQHILREADATPAFVVALAFAMFAIRLDTGEARDYLNAALADGGYPLLDEEGDR
ncbi:hypothetical protein [Streptomyces alfalfae]|uniref:Uncharacterized protein n=1 Tax=Streptomyces alfalfae TaxID=1642299 RepID=A0A7T4TYM3_9ACTN|nr:hypothetical protein [Streptomyces alfalfae]QQC89853.1 hypothetical protein I8755_16600 [Streptomyces alfalfae]